jgi:UDP-N-acetylmuramoyl-L-alanyl-D-glutamate--2,6-diaminopimelate ligase
MKLTELGKGLLKVASKWKDVEALGITNDSRHVKPGYLFVAVPGESADGHHYIGDAIKAGAVAVVGEKKPGRWQSREVPFISVDNARTVLGKLSAAFYQHPSRVVDVTGITGTKGKTTTSWILCSIFQATGRRAGLFGTILNRVGEEILPSVNTTPSSLEIERHLRVLADRGGSHAVMEVSSHGILQDRISGIEFRCGVFTNIAPEHLDYHGTFENYFDAKARFFERLSSSAVAVLPRGDEHAVEIARRTNAEVLWYSATPEDGFDRVECTPDGISLVWRGLPMRTRLWGEHNLQNLIAAIAAAEANGIERRQIVLGVEQAVSPPGRLEEVPCERGFRVFVDYAHTDNALKAVLLGLRPITPGRIITVFGCGGDRDRGKRPRMGRVAEELSDKVILTSDNPRSEDAGAILDEIAGGMERPFCAAMVSDRKEAITLGLRVAKPGDAVLIAGKGHEKYQEVKGRRIPFDDREVVLEALKDIAAAAAE